MAKIYEFYRNQKLGEESEAQGLERFGGGIGARSPCEKPGRWNKYFCATERNWQPDLIC